MIELKGGVAQRGREELPLRHARQRMLEARMTWRLDRLIYAGDEPTLERVRLERQDARSRLGQRTLEALFAWEKATIDEQDVTPGSRAEVLASLRTAQAAATLDVLTGGWFSSRIARTSREAEGDAP